MAKNKKESEVMVMKQNVENPEIITRGKGIRADLADVDRIINALKKCESCTQCGKVQEVKKMLAKYRTKLLESSIDERENNPAWYYGPDRIEYR